MIGLLASLTLLFGNAFFVGSEFALIASRRTVIEPLAATSRRARAALVATGQIPLMIAGAQLGITVCSLGLGAIAEPALAHLIERPLTAVGLQASVHPIALVLALCLVVFAHVVVGEMVPKNLTLAGPDAAVLWLAPPLLAFCLATKPLLVTLRWLAQGFLRLWHIPTTDAVKSVYTADELANLVVQSRTEGLLDPDDYARISGALALQTRTAEAAMRPWREVATVPEQTTPTELEQEAGRTGRSRFPVVCPTTEEVLGFVHVKDVIGLTDAARSLPIPRELLRRLDVVRPESKLTDLLIAMRHQRRHMVLVKAGRVPMGVVTLQDVLGVFQTSPTAPGDGSAGGAG